MGFGVAEVQATRPRLRGAQGDRHVFSLEHRAQERSIFGSTYPFES